MPTTTHMASRRDDERHVPGAGALPLWNESFWWTGYDPKAEIGVLFRIGAHPLQGGANVYLFITKGREVVHALTDHALPLALMEPSRLALPNGLTVEWDPLERFRLRYAHGANAFDLDWRGLGPVAMYPYPPDSTEEQVPRHIEHAGTVVGSVTIGGVGHAVRGLGHRDHSWGGERDWTKMPRWDYLNAEFGRDFWIHAVRVMVSGVEFTLGCLWDGTELHALDRIEIEGRYADGGTRQLGADLRAVDEHGRPHHVVAEEVLVHCCAPIHGTWVKDGIARWRMGDRIGFGIHELGYREEALT